MLKRTRGADGRYQTGANARQTTGAFFKLDRAVLEALRAHAAALGVTMAEVIETALVPVLPPPRTVGQFDAVDAQRTQTVEDDDKASDIKFHF